MLLMQQLPVLAQTPPVQTKQYVLRFGDALNVAIVGNEQLQIQQQPIRPDGRISLPLIGEVQAAGLTVPQLTDELARAFSRYFTAPQVVVNVAAFRPLSVSVLGMVNRPDTYTVPEPIHLLQAVALAGGLNARRADLSNVLVLRADGDKQIINLNDVLNGKVSDNLMLYDGDTVRVGEVWGPDWYELLPPLASALSIASTLIILILRP
ncbi:MAG TPA: polysaccharide biosynthesis/export family protein [Oscillatoriaceae cyanobacterium]